MQMTNAAQVVLGLGVGVTADRLYARYKQHGVACTSCGKDVFKQESSFEFRDAAGIGLCVDCFEAAGMENAHADGMHNDADGQLTRVTEGCPVCEMLRPEIEAAKPLVIDMAHGFVEVPLESVEVVQRGKRRVAVEAAMQTLLMAASSGTHMALRMRPARRHRPAIWESMLGTVFAMDDAGHIKYFDYDYEAARAYAGVDDLVGHVDPRLAPFPRNAHRYDDGESAWARPAPAQLVLWIA